MESVQWAVQRVVQWSAALAVYVLWEYIVGAVVTQVWRVVKRWYLEVGEEVLDWEFGAIGIRWGLMSGSTRVEVRKFRWGNPSGYKGHEDLMAIKRLEVEVDAASAARWFLSSATAAGRKKRAPIAVEYVEVDAVTVNLGRRRGALNLWAALGWTEEEAQEKVDTAKERWEQEDEEEDLFEEDGEAVPLETEEAAEEDDDYSEWIKELGAYEVRRVTVRHVKARVDAFAVVKAANDEKALRFERFELSKKQLRASKKRRFMYIDELVWKTSVKIATKATAVNPLRLVATGVDVVEDRLRAATKRLAHGVARAALNVTHATAREHRGSSGRPELVVVAHRAKHLWHPRATKPSSYLRVETPDGLSAKTPVAAASRNPDFNDYRLALGPVDQPTSLSVFAYAKRAFAEDIQIAARLDIRIDALPKTAWFPLPPRRDEAASSQAYHDKPPALLLTIERREPSPREKTP